MSSTSPERTDLPDANPGVDGSETGLRLASGRCTVDIVPSDRGLLALAGDGVGRPPVSALITPGAAAVVLDAADAVDVRPAFDTAAWPLTA